ncbi:hypothetical protein [Morganella morganii]|uniref:hypothetical protein n=1 Tax=Morganella morganii TaxID=582 RepID=UPI001C4963EB|nr:hypothetical protein [Morganella morganii]QXO65121.1 hypothetical protein JC825_17495 [Morganella morganii]
MINLSALSEDTAYLDRFIAIRDKKHLVTRRPLIAAHQLIEERYEAYMQAVAQNTLCNLQSDAQALQIRRPLRACYDVATKPLRDLKQLIEDAQPRRLLKYCPMCGVTLPGTFDHYLPASKFPEFAVHPFNLVPCCGTCNSTKDDDWLSVTGKRQYLHAYSDQVPAQKIVFVTLHENPNLDGVGATFLLQRPVNLLDEMWELIDSHFSRLKLLARYNELGNDEVAEILADCCTYIEAGGPDVRDFLRRRTEERSRIYGQNHWVVVLMDAMAQHDNLDQWIQAM